MKTNIVRFKRRKERVRAKLKKISNRKRLTVFKSGKHIYVQIIDDINSQTLLSASTLDSAVNNKNKSNCNIESAKKVGKLIAERARKHSITEVAFDKGGYKYHGIIKALAEEARKEIKF